MKTLALFLTLISVNTMANTQNHLTLYFIPSPVGMDWSSPADLAWSALKNRISMKPRFMGHVFVEFECDGRRELTGMVGKNFDYFRQLLINGRGLGILYHSFDGRLEESAELDQELADHFKAGRVNFARFVLNEKQCSRVSSYLQDYREQNIGKYYGLANRPLYGEGAGCSAFGASFLDVAGIMDEEIKTAWSNSVNIPLEFAGPPVREQTVNLLKVMFAAPKWAHENEPHKKLFFWDPDRMFKWVNEKAAQASAANTLRKDQAVGILIDKSHQVAPAGKIWQK